MHESTSENETGDELNISEITEQATNKEADEIKREILRDGETGAAADDNDIAGSPDKNDTMQGREEAKHQTTDKSLNDE